jgi:hypothetical protein
MAVTILERLKGVAIGEPVHAGNLTVLPLLGEEPLGTEWLSAEEAHLRKGFDVGEVSESGTVNTLLVTNRCELPVLLLDGEVLHGGKQNRVMNTSVLVPAGVTITIPVSCVERGRWSSGRAHRSAGHHVPSSLRSMMTHEVLTSLRERRGHQSSQREVWASVDRVLADSGSRSQTSDLSQAYEDHAREVLETTGALELPEAAVGALFVIDGRFVGGDVFDRSAGFKKFRARILRGAALDAIRTRGRPEPRPAVIPERILDRLQELSKAPPEVYSSPGAGSEVRSESGELHASALVFGKGMVHLGLFAVAQ